MTRTHTQCIWFDKSITKEQTHVSIIFLRVDIKKKTRVKAQLKPNWTKRIRSVTNCNVIVYPLSFRWISFSIHFYDWMWRHCLRYWQNKRFQYFGHIYFFLWGCAIITCGIYNAIQHFRRWRWRRRRMIVMLMNNDKMPIRFYVYTLCHLLFRMVFARLHSHLSRSQPKPIFNALCVCRDWTRL